MSTIFKSLIIVWFYRYLTPQDAPYNIKIKIHHSNISLDIAAAGGKS